jgi:hypothetical protein
MPLKMPRIDDLLVFLKEVFFAPERGVLPGGTATKAELDFAEKDSPIKGEDVKPGPWPGGASPDSVRDDRSAAVAGASSSFSPLLSSPPSSAPAAAVSAAVLGGFAACCRRRRLRRFFGLPYRPPFCGVFFWSELVSWLRLYFDSSSGGCEASLSRYYTDGMLFD